MSSRCVSPRSRSPRDCIYAAAHQLIYTILGTAAAVIAYQAYDRGRGTMAWWLAFAAGVAFVALAVSMRRGGRTRS